MNFNTPLPTIEDTDEEFDIQFTDGESESVYSETESDRAFIDSLDNNPEVDHDPSYVPSEAEETSSSSSSEISDNEYFYNHVSLGEPQLGEHGEMCVLDERVFQSANGMVEQLLINCWVDKDVLQDVLDLLNVSTGAIFDN
ncbi:hypothetical protein BJY01DRAFT_246912 [Aspergillus pseudoustus]|uniref:Uncharacterized protein n=1 Tax=Aspergillus pseudoustus TaxID=1810923 RepID=A0ABR4K5F1_9EURO